jgi:hypothetical protein
MGGCIDAVMNRSLQIDFCASPRPDYLNDVSADSFSNSSLSPEGHSVIDPLSVAAYSSWLDLNGVSSGIDRWIQPRSIRFVNGPEQFRIGPPRYELCFGAVEQIRFSARIQPHNYTYSKRL